MTNFLCPDGGCKGAARCPMADDSCPSVAEVGIERLTAERDEARRERDEAVKVLRDFGTDLLVLCPDSLDSAPCCEIECGSETCAVMRARAIVARHAGAEAEEPTPCSGGGHK